MHPNIIMWEERELETTFHEAPVPRIATLRIELNIDMQNVNIVRVQRVWLEL